MYIGAMIFLKKGFLKPQTFFNILNANAALIITSCGMSLVMITGGIDISVGGVVALVSMSCAVYLDYHGGSVFASLLIALGIGLAFGAVQGFLVAYLDIQPFIVSLAGMFFARGMTTIVHTAPFNVANEGFAALKDTRINVPGLGTVNKLGKYINAYVEIGVIVAVLVVIILFCILKWTKAGRNFYAVGGSRQSALMLGINVKKTRFLAHLLCGLLGGDRRLRLFPACRLRIGLPRHGHGDERNCVFHHRRNAADGRRRQYRRYVCRRAVTQHDSKYRFLHRPRSGVVDGNYRGRHAVPVFGGAEYDYGAEEEKGIRKKWMPIPRSGCSDRGIGVCGALLSARTVTFLNTFKQTLHFPNPILLRHDNRLDNRLQLLADWKLQGIP